jgi:hypothetical protein
MGDKDEHKRCGGEEVGQAYRNETKTEVDDKVMERRRRETVRKRNQKARRRRNANMCGRNLVEGLLREDAIPFRSSALTTTILSDVDNALKLQLKNSGNLQRLSVDLLAYMYVHLRAKERISMLSSCMYLYRVSAMPAAAAASIHLHWRSIPELSQIRTCMAAIQPRHLVLGNAISLATVMDYTREHSAAVVVSSKSNAADLSCLSRLVEFTTSLDYWDSEVHIAPLFFAMCPRLAVVDVSIVSWAFLESFADALSMDVSSEFGSERTDIDRALADGKVIPTKNKRLINEKARLTTMKEILHLCIHTGSFGERRDHEVARIIARLPHASHASSVRVDLLSRTTIEAGDDDDWKRPWARRPHLQSLVATMFVKRRDDFGARLAKIAATYPSLHTLCDTSIGDRSIEDDVDVDVDDAAIVPIDVDDAAIVPIVYELDATKIVEVAAAVFARSQLVEIRSGADRIDKIDDRVSKSGEQEPFMLGHIAVVIPQRGFPSLETIQVRLRSVSEMIAVFVGCHRLRVAIFANSNLKRFTETLKSLDPSALACCHTLRVLDISQTALGASLDGFRYLHPLTALEVLDLTSTSFEALADFSVLDSFQALRILSLANAGGCTRDEGDDDRSHVGPEPGERTILPSLPHLEYLNLYHSQSVGIFLDVAQLPIKCPRLAFLHAPDARLDDLATIQSLTSLDLGRARTGQLPSLAKLVSHLPRLVYLALPSPCDSNCRILPFTGKECTPGVTAAALSREAGLGKLTSHTNLQVTRSENEYYYYCYTDHDSHVRYRLPPPTDAPFSPDIPILSHAASRGILLRPQ